MRPSRNVQVLQRSWDPSRRGVCADVKPDEKTTKSIAKPADLNVQERLSFVLEEAVKLSTRRYADVNKDLKRCDASAEPRNNQTNAKR